MKEIQRVCSYIQTQSTQKLVNILWWFQLPWFILLVIWAILYQQYPNKLFLALFNLSLSFLMVGLFLIGAIMFLRKENPYTLTEKWFGIRIFSRGIWPRIIGLYLLLISIAVLITLLLPATIRIFTR